MPQRQELTIRVQNPVDDVLFMEEICSNVHIEEGILPEYNVDTQTFTASCDSPDYISVGDICTIRDQIVGEVCWFFRDRPVSLEIHLQETDY